MDSDRTWVKLAACKDQNLTGFFFKELPGNMTPVNQAKKFCWDSNCPVRSDCLEYAIKNNIDFGVWGGYSRKDRKRIYDARRMNGGFERVPPKERRY